MIFFVWLFSIALAMKPITVSELTGDIRSLLESKYQTISVIGEISNWKISPSGHAYCSLKDDKALLQAVMFRNRLHAAQGSIQDGLLVVATGTISVYEPRGQYQLIIDSLIQYGKGSLQNEFEELKRKLAAEGLFDLDKKKVIPAFPSSVVVITSPKGAAVHDVINTLQRRAPHCLIRILPARMQGTEAPYEIIHTIQYANKHKLGDVIILARGGGSSEDLSAFSNEELVRTVAASSLPIISAVGHETDWTLCDFAADLRAPTPTAAAELVSKSTVSLHERLNIARFTCITGINSKIQALRRSFDKTNTETMKLRILRLYEAYSQRHDYATTVCIYSMQTIYADAIGRCKTAVAVIESANPELILSRGYTIVKRKKTKTLIQSALEVKPHDVLELQFHDGVVTASAEENSYEKD